jgi:hypothetical protein
MQRVRLDTAPHKPLLPYLPHSLPLLQPHQVVMLGRRFKLLQSGA